MSDALDRGLRQNLKRTVEAARREAESGARAALGALAVERTQPDPGMGPETVALREHLRAHARALGDKGLPGGGQEITRLAHEVAYEHWHRMLFARFLAENGLLIEPDSGVAVTLDECRELAHESGEDPWELAARYAERMLPRIFRSDDPSLEVRLPPESRQALEALLAGLPAAVFRADDSIGWAYQFWQAEKKDAVNRSGVKIGADELSAVTQLFTEPYMVRFLFDNTVGAWRAGKILAKHQELAQDAKDETELREAVRLEAGGGYDFDYLRFVRDGDSGPWRPAAGDFSKWPRRAAEVRFLDPCCGSGHFLVEGFRLFVALRMEEEELGVEEAVRAVLRDNLHGLELDPRCTQLAAFSVALAAWKLVGKVFELPPLQIACSGLAPHATKAEWLELAVQEATEAPRESVKTTLAALHGLFQDGPTLGSLLNPRWATGTGLFAKNYEAIEALLDRVLRAVEGDPERRERAVAASGMAQATRLLAGTYTLVITNVPYLSRGKQDDTLRGFADTNHRAAKGDLATMFVDRAFPWLGESGAQAVVVPQNWLFLTIYRKFREALLTNRRWRLVAKLGPGAFETIGGHVVNVALSILSGDRPNEDAQLAGLDVSAPRGQTPIPATEKAKLLRTEEIRLLSQKDRLRDPEARITSSAQAGSVLLSSFGEGRQGIATADHSCFGRKFWEFPALSKPWTPQQSTVKKTIDFGGREHVVEWGEEGEIYEERQTHVRVQGGGIWNRQGVTISQMGALPATRYTGEKFDCNCAALGPLAADVLPAVWCFVSSPEYSRAVRELNQELKVTNATLAQVPFDIERWKQVAAEEYPNGLPEPYSDDPTQWIFHGHPCGSVIWDPVAKQTAEGPLRHDASVLQVAVARLCGYRWPAEHDREMRLAPESRRFVERSGELLPFADADGIVPLPALRGETPAADRLRELLAAAYGSAWSATVEQGLLRAAAGGKPPAESLDRWLRDFFFAEHCSLFHHRPFVWHIWDGLPGGFAALVNYHELSAPGGAGRKTLESLTHSYLGDWIQRQRAEIREGVTGAEARLEAALDLALQLERILAGETPLDIFVRWKPLAAQPIGWHPDRDDGVRVNIRPFLRAELPRGRKGAGVLRSKPNVHWRKDRGKEPQHLDPKRREEEYRPRAEFPWFWSCPGDGNETERTNFPGGRSFDGARWNDLHYSRAAKEAARRSESGDA